MDEQAAAILRALDYLESHLFEEAMVENMAAASGYSLFHFVRTFNRLVHHTPYDYITRRRLSEAARQLVNSKRRVIDISMDAGFHNAETFARAFKRMFGMQPSQVRAQGRIDLRYLLVPRSLAHLEHIQHCNLLQPVLVEHSPLQLAGLMTRVHGDSANIQGLWSALANEIETGKERYGVTTYPEDWQSNGTFYFAGVAIKEGEILPQILVRRELPAGKFSEFLHIGGRISLPLTRDYVYQTWLPRSGKRMAAALELEIHAGNTAEGNLKFSIPVQ